MSRLQKVILSVKPIEKITEEEMKDFDERWKLAYEGKSICITDPSKSGTPDGILEVLKNPNRKSSVFIDCDDDISYEEFYKRLMKGEYDEKEKGSQS